MDVFKMFNYIVLFFLFLLVVLTLCSCNVWQAAHTVMDVVRIYPEDNPVEQRLQDIMSEELDIDADLSFWDGTDEDKDWAGHSEQDQPCGCP